LLDIGRLAANKLILRKEPLELGGAVRRCVDALATTRGLAPGRIELELGAAWIEADPVRITQVMENLLGNALKHTPPAKRIRVVVRDIGTVVELRVEDEGFGIRPELLPKVFEPFTQGQQGLDRSAGGLGLGLTLVRRLTELHDGTIEAYSGGVDKGSVFTLRFPSRSAPVGAHSTASEQVRSDRPRRLLVVEDNVDARQTLRTLLEALGHEVHEAADGEAGVAAALERRPDLVFVDIGLPRLDGYEVARRLRAAKLGARLVALTGYGRDDDVQRARDAGFDEHLLKPATLEQLRAAIEGVAVG
jgi:CheY-like chemotaxis protein